MSGTLTTDQTKWLSALIPPTGGKGEIVTKSDAAAERLKTRAQVLEGVLGKIDTIKPDLVKASKQVEMMDKQGQKLKLLTGELDPDKEIDTRHDIGQDSKIVGDDQLQKITNLMSVIVAQQDVLRDAKVTPTGTLSGDGSGEPLFSESDIATEIWTPLFRAGVVPENLIVTRYSQVAKTFKGAQQAYSKRLQAFTEASQDKNDLIETLGLGTEAIKTCGNIADTVVAGILELNGAPKELKETYKNSIALIAAAGAGLLTVGQHLLEPGDVSKLIKAGSETLIARLGVGGLAETTQKILSKTVEGLLSASKIRENLLKGEFTAAAESLGDVVSHALDGVSTYYDIPEYGQLGGTIKGSIKSMASAKKLFEARTAGTEELVNAMTAFAKELGDLTAHVIKSNVENQQRLEAEQKKKEIDDGLQDKLKIAQRQLETITTQCISTKALGEKINEIVDSSEMNLALEVYAQLGAKVQELQKSVAKGRDPEPIGRAIGELIVDAMNKAKALEDLRTLVVQEVENAKKLTDEVQGPSDVGEPEGDEEDAGGADSEKIKEALARLEAARQSMSPEEALLAGVEIKARTEALQKDSEDFAQMLNNDFAGAMAESEDPVQQARLAVAKLEPLIAKLKQDKAWLKLMDTLANVPLKVAAAMFEQAGPLGSFKECAQNMYAAVQHLRELQKWQQSMADSRNAGASELVAAEFNRAGLEESYKQSDFINAGLKAIETIGSALKLSVALAPVGGGIEVASKLTSETAKLVTKYFDAGKLKKAWRDYETAIADPEDRKNIRQALRSNPTLSKYALAWAAVEGQSQLARDAMRSCGLSDAVLNDKDTNAHAVVEYLETLFDRDPIVLKSQPSPDSWWPAAVELSSRGWMKFLKAAADAEGSLQDTSGLAITQLLVRMEKQLPAAQATPIDETAVKLARATVDELIDALDEYTPLKDNDDPHDSMRKYASAMQALAELQRRNLPAGTPVTV